MYPNKIRISNGEGQVSITAISRAFEVGQVAEEIVMNGLKMKNYEKR